MLTIIYSNIIIMNDMMKKYFLKGKQYLNKKLEQYDVSIGKIDYMAQQIPNRLRQPLAVLQQEQIDIEDTHAYETYFKSYPNHHLSHFLLDKYNMMIGAEAEPNKYDLPNNNDTHIPAFDEKLEHNALLFRQVIQQYDEGYAKNDEPIICICVINFHHKRGTEIQYRYPQNKTVQSIQSMIVHHAMPDSSHNKHEDYNYFNFQAPYKDKKRMLFGVSYFKQIKLTENMKKNNPEFTRSYLQKAVAIVSTLPLFGYLKVKLCITTKVFFEKFTNFQIIDAAHKQLNKHLADSWPNMQINNLYIGSDLKVIIKLFSVTDFYEIWKAILYQKRIVIFGHSSSSVSSFILSMLSLFPGLSTFGIFSKPIAKYMQALRQLALPLKFFNDENFLSISFHIQDFDYLMKFKNTDKGNFLLGTTNRLLKQSGDYGIEMLVNLQNCTVEKKKPRIPWQGLSKKQKNFLNELDQLVSKQKSSGFEGSEESIQNHFHSFLKGALIQIITGIKAFEKFVNDCKQYEKNHSKSQQNKPNKRKGSEQIKTQKQQTSQGKPENLQSHSSQNDLPPLFPQQTSKIIFPELLLKKSFAYFRQFKNEKMPQIVNGKLIPSLLINNYDYLLRLNKEEFISYNWIDKKLTFGKGNNKNFEGKQIRFKTTKSEQDHDQTKSIYVGHIENGKYTKNGYYVDEFENYEGEYNQGMKEGYGKLITENQKYLGNFHKNMFDGQGQLVVGSNIYVGQFKLGKKNGFGSMQGGTNFQGTWEDDKPVQPVEKSTNQKPLENSQNTSIENKTQNSSNDVLVNQQISKQQQQTCITQKSQQLQKQEESLASKQTQQNSSQAKQQSQ